MSTTITSPSRPQSLSLPDLAQQIRAAHAQCESSARQGLIHAIEAGNLLVAAKKMVSHGQWLPWLANNTGIAERSAQLYMRAANRSDELASKSATVSDLTLRGALSLLSEPKPATKQAATTSASNTIESNARELEEGDVDDEPVADADQGAVGSRAKDQLGRIIEHEHIAQAFRHRGLFEEFMREISGLKRRFHELAGLPGGKWAGPLEQQFNADVNNLHRAVRESMPHAVCPMCGGNGCVTCKSVGFLPKEKYETKMASLRSEGGTDAA